MFFKDLYPIKYLKFNDIKVPVPNNCDAYLKGQYGDYMKLPPKEKRHGHLPYKVQFDIKGEH